MSKNDFDGQGLGVAHAEAGHTVNWSAAVARDCAAGEPLFMTPTTGIARRCACTSGQDAAVPPRSDMNSCRRMSIAM
jgi:hypothetical protein